VSAADREAPRDYSRANPAPRAGFRVTAIVRALLAVVGFAGAVALVAATFSTVIQIKVVTVTKAELSGYDRHGAALLVIAGFAVVMLVGAMSGARPAAAALAIAGIAALLIAVIGDAPDVHKTGEVGELFEKAAAGAKSGFYFETLGGVLLLIAGGGLLLLATGRAAPDPGDHPG
jgi:hypothetical protein